MNARSASRRNPAHRSGHDLVDRLRSDEPLLAVELRPPRRGGPGVDAWIDLYHAVRRLTAEDTLVFTTDSATGSAEEESLRHLRANLGADADLSRVIPFLTVKHTLEYCLRFPRRAEEAGHRAVVVVGGDRHDGVPRCVAHASELRRLLRDRYPGLALGGWANPYQDPAWQVELIKREEASTDFVLTQVVSHHDLAPVERFLEELGRQGVSVPVLFGVFYYRSARPRTLEMLRDLLPVPIEGLVKEMDGEGLNATQVCLRTLGALAKLGVRRVYQCNLAPSRAASLLPELVAALG